MKITSNEKWLLAGLFSLITGSLGWMTSVELNIQKIKDKQDQASIMIGEIKEDIKSINAKLLKLTNPSLANAGDINLKISSM